MFTKRTLIHCLKHFQTNPCGSYIKLNRKYHERNALSKKRPFQKMLFENPVPLNMRFQIQPRPVASLLTKWPVFLQNASGNPVGEVWGLKKNKFLYNAHTKQQTRPRHICLGNTFVRSYLVANVRLVESVFREKCVVVQKARWYSKKKFRYATAWQHW